MIYLVGYLVSLVLLSLCVIAADLGGFVIGLGTSISISRSSACFYYGTSSDIDISHSNTPYYFSPEWFRDFIYFGEFTLLGSFSSLSSSTFFNSASSSSDFGLYLKSERSLFTLVGF